MKIIVNLQGIRNSTKEQKPPQTQTKLWPIHLKFIPNFMLCSFIFRRLRALCIHKQTTVSLIISLKGHAFRVCKQ